MKSRDQTHAATSRHKNQPFSNNNITILGYNWRKDSSSTLENKICVKMLLRQYSVCFFTFMKSSKASYVVGKFRPKVGSAKDTHPPWKSEMDGSPCIYIIYHICIIYQTDNHLIYNLPAQPPGQRPLLSWPCLTNSSAAVELLQVGKDSPCGDFFGYK